MPRRDMPDQSAEENQDEEKQPELLSHPSYEELLQKLDETEQQCNQHWERILRMQAEADNMTRRSERDIANAHKSNA